MLVTAREVVVAFDAMIFVANKFPAVSAVDDAYGNIEFCVVEVEITNPTVGDDDALMVRVPPRETSPPPVAIPLVLMVMDENARSAFATVAHDAAPAPLSERTNWLVQDVPP